VQLEIGGVRVLTDPALAGRLAHLKRHHVVDASAIEPPDVILISHVHLDHLHLPSLRRFDRDVAPIAPAGAGGLLRRKGFRNVTETRAGATTSVGRLTIETVPAVHPRGRLPHGRVSADPVGYVLRAEGTAAYFPGDTGPFDEMATWAPIDLALLPIWGWGPSLGEGHLDPSTARDAVQRLQPRLVVPIHWGTYSPVGLWRPRWLETPADRFRAELAADGLDGLLRVLAPGDDLVVASGAAADPRNAEP
jgi:L-ascorbate metabolism protein UlaG (beta-lactamase superfamily)